MIKMLFLRFVIYAVISCLQIQYIFCAEGKDNKGKHFIFGFMYNQPNVALEVYITTDCSCIVNVNISTPRFDPNYSQTLSIGRQQLSKVSFRSQIQGGPGIVLKNNGIEITADSEITVYAVNKDLYTTDAFVVFPLDTLGNNYYIITWTLKAEFMIIATEENTEVSLVIADGTHIIYNSVNYSQGMMLRITMNRYQTFHVFGGPDYTGTSVTSNKPVTVISGADCANIGEGGCDHLSSQMTPVETFGNTFVTINMPNCKKPVHFKVVASENETSINITGKASVMLSKPGDKYLFEITDQSSKILSSDKPIAVAFFSEGGCGLNYLGDPAMLLLAPTQQFASDYTFTTIDHPSNTFSDALTIVIPDSEIFGLKLDGQNISSAAWRPIDGSEDLRILDLNITKGAHSIYHVNPTVTFLAVSTGLARTNAYAYSSGQRLAPINSNCTISVSVPGDIIDNDCDGLIDEELQDGTDNDGDGEIDEDLAKPFEELKTTTTSTTFTSTTTPKHSTTAFETPTPPTTTTIPPTTTSIYSATTEVQSTTTPKKSTTTSTHSTTSNVKEIVGENLSTDMVIAGVLSSLFALSCLSTAVYFLKRKLRGKSGQVEDVFSSISSNNVPPVHNTVQNKA